MGEASWGLVIVSIGADPNPFKVVPPLLLTRTEEEQLAMAVALSLSEQEDRQSKNPENPVEPTVIVILIWNPQHLCLVATAWWAAME